LAPPRTGARAARLADDVADEVRPGPVAADVQAVADAVGELGVEARVLAGVGVGVDDEAEVEHRSAERVLHLPGLHVPLEVVVVGVLAPDGVDAVRAAVAEAPGEAEDVLLRARRDQAVADLDVDAADAREVERDGAVRRERVGEAAAALEPAEELLEEPGSS
jgi:hypothetical protein